MHKVVILLLATAMLGSFAKQAHSQFDEFPIPCGASRDITGQEIQTRWFEESLLFIRPFQNELWSFLSDGRYLCAEGCPLFPVFYFPEPVEPLEANCIDDRLGPIGYTVCIAMGVAPPTSRAHCEWSTTGGGGGGDPTPITP